MSQGAVSPMLLYKILDSKLDDGANVGYEGVDVIG